MGRSFGSRLYKTLKARLKTGLKVLGKKRSSSFSAEVCGARLKNGQVDRSPQVVWG
jgi:hypothetical protein